MQIGIVSCYYNHNYGSMLQAYANQQALQKLGYHGTTICCPSPKQFMPFSKTKYYFHRLLQSLFQKDVLIRKIREMMAKATLAIHPKIKKKIVFRDKLFDQFWEKRIYLSAPSSSRIELTQLAGKFDAVIVGSDQLWNPANIEQDFYTLTFVPESVRKISYATSFGVVSLPDRQQYAAIEFLKRFYAISVRETSGAELIHSLGLNKDVEVVLDPTLLFDAADWDDLLKQSIPKVNGKYILCYFLGRNPDHREMACQIQNILGYKIVALQHLDGFVKGDESFGDEKPYDVGPEEFVNLIKNAAFVCTDSFHGTCFSIIYHKDFLTMDRFFKQNSESTNSRIDSLLNMTGLSSRHLTGRKDDDELRSLCMQEIDFSKVDKVLKAERSRSYLFLKDALEG